MNRTPVPLNVIEVQEPCPASWDAMRGDERTRFCEGCGRHVHNLSAMPAGEAERLLCESAGRLCVRFARATDGAVVTLDCHRPRHGRGWRLWCAIAACGAAIAAAADVVLLRRARPAPTFTVGEVCVNPPPAQGQTSPTLDDSVREDSASPTSDAAAEVP